MSEEREDEPGLEEKPEEKAAKQHKGQAQEPKQAEDDEGRSLFDTDQHSDAPGPFGTG